MGDDHSIIDVKTVMRSISIHVPRMGDDFGGCFFAII